MTLTERQDNPVPMLERLLVAYGQHFPIQRGKLRLINSLWARVSGMGSPHRLARLKFGDCVVDADITQNLQRQYYFTGTYFVERLLVSAWCALAGNAEVVLDVGANSGIYSLAALSMAPRAISHAFEPTPVMAAILRRNAKRNFPGRLLVQELAVSDREGVALLQTCRGSNNDNEGMNQIVTEAGGGETLAVTTTTLDAYCAHHGVARIDLLKLDIQGHEAAALQGATGLLEAGAIKTMLLELNWGPPQRTDSPADACVERLAAHGYRFASAGDQQFREAGRWLRGHADIFATSVS